MYLKRNSLEYKDIVIYINQRKGRKMFELMPEIKIKKSRLEMIRKGVKTATLRDGHRNYEVNRETSIVNSENPLDSVQVTINKLVYLKYSQIDLAVAKKQGYDTVEAFLTSLKDVYPNLTADSEVTHVEFSVIK